jgi:thiol-disulfide isomerase/thioredoxin
MRTLQSLTVAVIGCLLGVGPAELAAQSNVHTVPLTYTVPGDGPRPNYSPTGTRVELAEVPPDQALPAGAAHPARSGVLKVGPTRESWIPILLTAAADEPGAFTRLYIDMNRNGDFSDDGPPAPAILSRNEETGNLTIRFNEIELRVRFPEPERTEPYVVGFWMFHSAANPEPDSFIRYSGGSWRAGSVTVNGVPALVAAMDKNNDALYGPGDDWGVAEASMPEASKYVLRFHFGTGKGEMHPTDRLMFLQRDGDEPDLVLEFRSFAADGSSITFAVVDHPITKAEDRVADDMAALERTRPRATTAYTWLADLDAATAAANASGKPIFLYFETDWCSPCRIMDQWIWTDADVVAALEAGYVGVKLDGDIAKEQVRRYEVTGYPNILIVDPATGTALRSVKGYQSSQQLLDFLRGTGG